jgi:hypothetical protein
MKQGTWKRKLAAQSKDEHKTQNAKATMSKAWEWRIFLFPLDLNLTEKLKPLNEIHIWHFSKP